MIGLLLLLALAQPGVCEDRSPGLSKCVEYKTKGAGWTCSAACYRPNHKDGGTDGELLHATGSTQDACRKALETQCAAPAGK